MRTPPRPTVDTLIEERIQDAQRRGEFDNLPGTGKPLELDDDLLVPPEVRAAYRVLKNAGYVPNEILEHREIADLQALLPRLPEGAERVRVVSKLALLRTRLGHGRGARLLAEPHYARRIIDKLTGSGS